MKMSFNLPDDLAAQFKRDADASGQKYTALLSSILRRRYSPPNEVCGENRTALQNQIQFISLLLRADEIPASMRKLLQKEIERLCKMIETQL